MADIRYLAHINQQRECETIDRLFLSTFGTAHLLLPELGMRLGRLYFVGARIPFEYFDDSVGHNGGDIDVLIVPVRQSEADGRGMYVTDFDQVIGLEIYVPFFDDNDELKGGLGAHRNRIWYPGSDLKSHNAQARKLAMHGFHLSALTIIVPASPRDGVGNFRSYGFAAQTTRRSAKAASIHLESFMQTKYVREDDMHGIALWSIGAVPGSSEAYANSMSVPRMFRQPVIGAKPTPFRERMISKLRQILPGSFEERPERRIIRACRDRQCRNVFVWESPFDVFCPSCRSDLL